MKVRPEPILVIGATGGTGRLVVDELVAAGVPVRGLARQPDSAAFHASVEVVAGDLTVPASLDAGPISGSSPRNDDDAQMYLYEAAEV